MRPNRQRNHYSIEEAGSLLCPVSFSISAKCSTVEDAMSNVPFLDAMFGTPTNWDGAPFLFTMELGGAPYIARGTLSYQPGGFKPFGRILTSTPPQFFSSEDTIYWVGSPNTSPPINADGQLSFAIVGPSLFLPPLTDNPYLLSVTWAQFGDSDTMICRPVGAQCGTLTTPTSDEFGNAIFGAWTDEHSVLTVFTITAASVPGSD
jgi:hypothetical protein